MSFAKGISSGSFGIGDGELGGKAHGLVLIRDLLGSEFEASRFREPDIDAAGVRIHDGPDSVPDRFVRILRGRDFSRHGFPGAGPSIELPELTILDAEIELARIASFRFLGPDVKNPAGSRG